MDRKYRDIRNSIVQQAPAFIEYLRCFVLDERTLILLKQISSQTDVYIFSGVIRNYLLGEPFSRDLDLVVNGLDKIKISNDYLKDICIKRNSFGGLKVTLYNMSIDMWDIKHTWTIMKNRNMKPTPFTLIETAFFNFSSIVYDVRNRRFIFGNDFMEFYMFRKIDIVNDRNPNPALCIVNTLYYAIKLQCPIKYRLCKWIVSHYQADLDFINVQLSHFKYQLFSLSDINKFYKICLDVLPKLKQNQKEMSLSIFGKMFQ